jgi:tetratricopeptide (TPR) repeat protein/tRNA A-37 threonylcarbamoyl transferase component Bud32
MKRKDPDLEKTAKPLSTVPYKKGDFIGQEYEVQGVLGIGGFGIVYLVNFHRTKMLFALKTFRDEYLADGCTRERFRKEANVWVELERHPYLVRAYYVSEVSGRLYILMEYIAPNDQGLNSLEGFFKRQSPDLAQSLRWAIQICHGMDHAKVKGVRAHRDLKPANILIDQDGTVKITDFGLAGVLSESSEFHGIRLNTQQGRIGFSGQTLEGAGFGTPTYMSPEQFDHAAGCDERSDIYSFGIMLYQMATGGRVPFLAPLPKDNSEAEMMRFWREMHRLHSESPVPRLDSPLSSIIQRCLEKDPGKRYPSFDQLRSDLDPMYKRETGEVIKLPQMKGLEDWEWVFKGISLDSIGRHEEAIQCYDKALVLDPRNTDSWNNKGNSLHSLGRHEEAILCFDRALEIKPDEADAWNNKGNGLDSLDRYEEAIRCFEKALDLNPRFAAAWSNKGNSLNKWGRYEDAICCFNQALELDPRMVEAWSDNGVSLHSLGRYDEAICCFNKALELNPLATKVLNNKGSSLNRKGRFEEAICLFEKALEIDPRYSDAWNNKGNSLDNLGRYEEAFHCYEQAMEYDPKFYLGWIGKGNSLGKLGRYEEAIRCFEKVLEIDPRYIDAWIGKGRILNVLGRYQEAIHCYNKILELDPQHVEAWKYKGDSLDNLGRFQEAILCYEKALEFDPRFSDAWNNKGLILGKMGHIEESIHCFDQALEFNSRHVDAWNNKGYSLYRLGHLEEAIRCYDQALELNPRLPFTWFNKAVAHEFIKARGAAIISWKKYIEVARGIPSLREGISQAEMHLRKLGGK